MSEPQNPYESPRAKCSSERMPSRMPDWPLSLAIGIGANVLLAFAIFLFNFIESSSTAGVWGYVTLGVAVAWLVSLIWLALRVGMGSR